eukprot:s830_g5.t1
MASNSLACFCVIKGQLCNRMPNRFGFRLYERRSLVHEVAAVTDMIQPASLPYAPAGSDSYDISIHLHGVNYVELSKDLESFEKAAAQAVKNAAGPHRSAAPGDLQDSSGASDRITVASSSKDDFVHLRFTLQLPEGDDAETLSRALWSSELKDALHAAARAVTPASITGPLHCDVRHMAISPVKLSVAFSSAGDESRHARKSSHGPLFYITLTLVTLGLLIFLFCMCCDHKTFRRYCGQVELADCCSSCPGEIEGFWHWCLSWITCRHDGICDDTDSEEEWNDARRLRKKSFGLESPVAAGEPVRLVRWPTAQKRDRQRYIGNTLATDPSLAVRLGAARALAHDLRARPGRGEAAEAKPAAVLGPEPDDSKKSLIFIEYAVIHIVCREIAVALNSYWNNSATSGILEDLQHVVFDDAEARGPFLLTALSGAWRVGATALLPAICNSLRRSCGKAAQELRLKALSSALVAAFAADPAPPKAAALSSLSAACSWSLVDHIATLLAAAASSRLARPAMRCLCLAANAEGSLRPIRHHLRPAMQLLRIQAQQTEPTGGLLRAAWLAATACELCDLDEMTAELGLCAPRGVGAGTLIAQDLLQICEEAVLAAGLSGDSTVSGYEILATRSLEVLASLCEHLSTEAGSKGAKETGKGARHFHSAGSAMARLSSHLPAVLCFVRHGLHRRPEPGDVSVRSSALDAARALQRAGIGGHPTAMATATFAALFTDHVMRRSAGLLLQHKNVHPKFCSTQSKAVHPRI